MTIIQKHNYYSFLNRRRKLKCRKDEDKDSFIISVDVSDDGLMTIYVNTSNPQNFTIDWGDGIIDNNVSGNISHSYIVNDIYDIKINGSFELKFIDNIVHYTKVIEMKQWGTHAFRTLEGFFGKCKRMIVTASDVPDLSVCTSTRSMFSQCYLFNNSINSWDLSNVSDMTSMFYYAKTYNQETIINGLNCTVYSGMFKQCENLNSDVTILNNSSTLLINMFYNAYKFNSNFNIDFVDNMNLLGLFRFADMSTTDISNYDYSKVSYLKYIIDGTNISTDNYSKLLVSMNSSITFNNDTFYATNIKYNELGDVARQSLIDNKGWTFLDGGLAT